METEIKEAAEVLAHQDGLDVNHTDGDNDVDSNSKVVPIGSDAWEKAYLAACYAVSWTENNPLAWSYICGVMQADAKAHRRVSIQRSVELMRKKCFVDRKGKCTRISNTVTPCLIRMASRLYPEVYRYAVVRPSVFDSQSMPWDSWEPAL